jgi:hypothetical protein
MSDLPIIGFGSSCGALLPEQPVNAVPVIAIAVMIAMLFFIIGICVFCL